MTTQTFKIEGMTCDHCVMHVTEAFKSVDGVKSAKVSLKKSAAAVKFEEPATIEAMAASVAEAGYKLA